MSRLAEIKKMSDSESEVEYEPEIFQIGPHKIELTTIAYMPIEKLAKNQSNGVEISGQKLWCGSLVVIEYLLNNPDFVRGKVTIELGAVTGLLGMICSLLGSKQVFLTDHDQKSITHMQNDIKTNQLNYCDVAYMNWHEVESIESSLKDWLADTAHNESILRIVAGDVLYKASLLQPFFETVQKLFSLFVQGQNDGAFIHQIEMLLCHVPRAGNDHQHVVAKAIEFNFKINEISSDLWKKGVCTELSPEEDYSRAKLYRINQ